MYHFYISYELFTPQLLNTEEMNLIKKELNVQRLGRWKKTAGSYASMVK